MRSRLEKWASHRNSFMPKQHDRQTPDLHDFFAKSILHTLQVGGSDESNFRKKNYTKISESHQEIKSKQWRITI